MSSDTQNTSDTNTNEDEVEALFPYGLENQELQKYLDIFDYPDKKYQDLKKKNLKTGLATDLDAEFEKSTNSYEGAIKSSALPNVGDILSVVEAMEKHGKFNEWIELGRLITNSLSGGDSRLANRLLTKILTTHQDENLPKTAPALWSERTTGREVSPADFIKEHYAPWLGNGLTRAHLAKIDKPLYSAYSKQIERNPDKKIKELLDEERVFEKDPKKAIERSREKTRLRTQKYRMSI